MSSLLRKLNSATQYPSIPTYHKMGERGRLTEELQVEFDGHIVVAEKIDGTNARIILPPSPTMADELPWYYIGSRAELLTACGDLVPNPTLGIVDAVRDVAEKLIGGQTYPRWTVVFGEVYGGEVGDSARSYSSDRATVGFRVFDVAEFDADVLNWEVEKIARWRDSGGQQWRDAEVLWDFARETELKSAPCMAVVTEIPVTVAETHEWLTKIVDDRSRAALDDDAPGGIEGVVVRSWDRSRIAKIRFEDYARTLRSQQ